MTVSILVVDGESDVAELFRQPHVGTVLFDKPRHSELAAALATGARDFEHRDLAGEVAAGEFLVVTPGQIRVAGRPRS
jgi:hypothetical protein